MTNSRDRYLAWTAANIVSWTGRAQEDQHLDFKLLDKPEKCGEQSSASVDDLVVER